MLKVAVVPVYNESRNLQEVLETFPIFDRMKAGSLRARLEAMLYRRLSAGRKG